MLGMAYIKVTVYQNASNAFKKAIILESENELLFKKVSSWQLILSSRKYGIVC